MDDMGIDRQSSVPLKVQLVDDLTARLAAGEFKVGQKFPSLRTLAAEYEVAEMTISSAVQELQRAGYLAPTPSKGNFVRVLPEPSATTTAVGSTGAGDVQDLRREISVIKARLDALERAAGTTDA
ncbi:MAG: GntR family transcriptional regulator [Catenulispora sp.]